MAIGVLLIVISLWIGQGHTQCSLEVLENNLGGMDDLVSTRLVAVGQSGVSPPPVQIFQIQTVCLAVAEQRGVFRGASVVVNYTCTSTASIPECTTAATNGFVVSQFDLSCDTDSTNANGWDFSIIGSNQDTLTTPADGGLSTPLRRDCSFCINPDRSGFEAVDDSTHCFACDQNCNVGLMQCTEGGANDCCNYYNNDTCVAECPAPRRPTDENNCDVFCDALPQPANAMPIDLSNGVQVGSVASYSCNVGYSLVGVQNRTCVVDGLSTMWTNSEPECQSVLCDALPQPANAMPIDLSNGVQVGSVASYSCNVGYSLVGVQNRTCDTDGSSTMWTGSEPMCQIVDCGDLENPTNGQVSHESGTVFNSTATYTCDNTAEPITSGEETRTCQASGEWSGTAPVCECKSGFKEKEDTGVCEEEKGKSGLTPGGIAGIVIGSIIGLILLILIIAIIAGGIYYASHRSPSKC